MTCININGKTLSLTDTGGSINFYNDLNALYIDSGVGRAALNATDIRIVIEWLKSMAKERDPKDESW